MNAKQMSRIARRDAAIVAVEREMSAKNRSRRFEEILRAKMETRAAVEAQNERVTRLTNEISNLTVRHSHLVAIR